MWQNLPEHIALRWDNADRMIAGVGLVACTVLAILGGIGCMLESRSVEIWGEDRVSSPFILRYGFTVVAVTWVVLAGLVAIWLAYRPRLLGPELMILLFLAAGWFYLWCFGVGLHDQFNRGMRSIM